MEYTDILVLQVSDDLFTLQITRRYMGIKVSFVNSKGPFHRKMSPSFYKQSQVRGLKENRPSQSFMIKSKSSFALFTGSLVTCIKIRPNGLDATPGFTYVIVSDLAFAAIVTVLMINYQQSPNF